MGWIRPDDVLEGVDAAGAETELACQVRRKHGFVVRADHDAAVQLAHDLKNLINKHVVRGNLAAVENGSKKHPVAVLQDLLAFLASDSGDEECRIYFEVSPTLTVRRTERDVADLIKAAQRRLVDRRQEGVVEGQGVIGHGGEAQIAHERPFERKDTDDEQV